MNPAVTAAQTEAKWSTPLPGWPVAQAADGDSRALAELIERYLDRVHAVVRFLGGEDGSAERTARAAAAAAAAGSWSREEELAARLFRAAAATEVGGAPGPAATPPARRALALVELAGRPLEDAAAEGEIGKTELRGALAAGRTALRRARKPLAGGGRCLRARRLLSDRLDEPLAGRDAALLGAHLANCLRCPEHDDLLGTELESLRGRFRQPAPGEVGRAVRAAIGAPPRAAGNGPVAFEPGEASESTAMAGKRSQSQQDPEPAKAGEQPASESTEAAPREGAARRRQPALKPGHTPTSERRRVTGVRHTPTIRRQLAVFAVFFAAVAALTAGVVIAAGKLDKPVEQVRQTAPWAKPGAPAIPPSRFE